MIIQKINLQSFRNYPKKTFEFSEAVNLVIGDNAVGKTNLLEAIYLLATGKSLRVKSVEREMILYGEEIARVSGIIQKSKIKNQNQNLEQKTNDNKNNYDEIYLEIVLTTGEVMGEKAGKKKYLVDGVPKRSFDYLGNLRAVYFGPEDLELITDSPGLRRRYLDSVLCQIDREYARCLLAYEKGIRARNKILEAIREVGDFSNGQVDRNRLYYWDQLVIKNGDVVTRGRQKYIEYLNDKHNSITGFDFTIEYDFSAISQERLTQYEKEEVYAATTLVGPHRDDFKIKVTEGTEVSKVSREVNTDRDLAVYGSRGEQRLAVLWIKLGELAFIEEITKEKPILLLDDVFSELDEGHRQLVYGLAKGQQTIITTADKEVLGELGSLKEAKQFVII